MPRKSARGLEGDEGQLYGHRFTADASFVGCCFDVISAAIPCTVIDLGSGRGTSVFDTSDPHGFNRSDPFTAALCQKKVKSLLPVNRHRTDMLFLTFQYLLATFWTRDSVRVLDALDACNLLGSKLLRWVCVWLFVSLGAFVFLMCLLPFVWILATSSHAALPV